MTHLHDARWTAWRLPVWRLASISDAEKPSTSCLLPPQSCKGLNRSNGEMEKGHCLCARTPPTVAGHHTDDTPKRLPVIGKENRGSLTRRDGGRRRMFLRSKHPANVPQSSRVVYRVQYSLHRYALRCQPALLPERRTVQDCAQPELPLREEQAFPPGTAGDTPVLLSWRYGSRHGSCYGSHK